MLKRTSTIIAALLLVSGCRGTPDVSDLPGAYASGKSDIAEAIVIRADGSYLHSWNIDEPRQQVGAWTAGRSEEGCLPVTFSKFSSLRRFPGETLVTGTYATCLERDISGQLFLVVDRDQGLSLTKK